jgi:hypothetical protein
MKVRSRGAELARGALYALGLDVVSILLVGLVADTGLIWVLALVWAMVGLVLTGVSVMEERYWMGGGFWLVQGTLFAVVLAAGLKVLGVLCAGGRCG